MENQVLRGQFQTYIESERILLHPHGEDLKNRFFSNKGSFSNDFFVISVQAIYDFIDNKIGNTAYKYILPNIQNYVKPMQRINMLTDREHIISSNCNFISPEGSEFRGSSNISIKASQETTVDDDFSFQSACYLFENKAFYDALKKAKKKYESHDDRGHLSDALVMLEASPLDKPEMIEAMVSQKFKPAELTTPPKPAKTRRPMHAWVESVLPPVQRDNSRIRRNENHNLKNINNLAKIAKVSRSTIADYFRNHPESHLVNAWKCENLRKMPSLRKT